MNISDPKIHLKALLADHPDWKLDEDPVIAQGWASSVFKGRVAGGRVVFKYHKDTASRQREIWALSQIRDMDKVPRIIESVDQGPVVLTMMDGSLFQFPYEGIDVPLGPETMTVMTEVASFFADLNAHSFQIDGSDPGDFDGFLADVLAQTRRYLEMNVDWREPAYMQRSLKLWEDRLPAISKEKRCIFYDDYNLTNIFVKGGHFHGIIDFGMAREGTVSAQLGLLLYSTIAHRPSRPAVLQAYEDKAGQVDVEVWRNALALFQFQVWERLACWGGWENNFPAPALLATAMQDLEDEFVRMLERRMVTGRWI